MIVIVGKSGCPRCDQAKQVCSMNGVPYEYKVIHQDVQIEQLEEIAGGRVSSVPQIYISEDGLNAYIGGYNDLANFLVKTKFEPSASQVL